MVEAAACYWGTKSDHAERSLQSGVIQLGYTDIMNIDADCSENSHMSSAAAGLDILTASDVEVTYPNGIKALAKTSVAFQRGTFTVLLGTSGAGKSTLLRSLNGLVRPTKGDVLAAGQGSIFKSGRDLRAHRRRTGMVFQQHHLIGRLSALENVLTGRLSSHGTLRSLLPLPRADRIIALEALQRVGLVERALDRADNLSGGQQQRVGIARAIAQRPEIILADEPVASLDPETSVRVLRDLHRICREDGITAIVSLHQLDLARQFADRIIGLANGRIVFEGTGSELGSMAFDNIYKANPASLREAAE
jgi:phosphonate transport system ATP-binding protein